MISVNKKIILIMIVLILLSGVLLVFWRTLFGIPLLLSQVGNETTQVANSYACEGGTCHELKVVCEDLNATTALIRERFAENPKASIILTTDSTGKALYSEQSGISAETVNLLLHQGINVYEVSWTDSLGWASNAEGKGLIKTGCRFAEVANWIAKQNQITAQKICASGNGEGAHQIASGLVFYKLEQNLKTAILSGGPPFSRLDIACFGDPKRPDAKLNENINNKPLIDYIMGWRENGDYCTLGNADTSATILAKASGLVTENVNADYFFDTNLVFINSNDETNADDQGRIFYDQVSSEKEWINISGTRHDIPNTREGAEKMSEVLISECLN